MSPQSFRPIKRSTEDILFSQIIRFGKTQCQFCFLCRPLQACHIFGRGAKSTRWMLDPKPNAVALCSSCHDWFDQHKDETPIFNKGARSFVLPHVNSYARLVQRCGYTYEELALLYVKAHQPFVGYKQELPRIRQELLDHLNKLKRELE